MELFAKIVKMGLTFPTSRGNRLPQELWSLPLVGNNGYNLDEISKELLQKIRSADVESLVVESKADPLDLLRLEVLKVIIKDKQDEQKAAQERKAKIAQRNELLRRIAKKQDEKEDQKSLEELYKELDSLGL